MRPSALEAEHARLHAELTEHDARYYQHDAPTITDAAYEASRTGRRPWGRFAEVDTSPVSQDRSWTGVDVGVRARSRVATRR